MKKGREAMKRVKGIREYLRTKMCQTKITDVKVI